jgi:hypothetical protein
MSIGTNIDKMHPNLKAFAKSDGFWDGVEPFNWSNVIGNDITQQVAEGTGRLQCGSKLLMDTVQKGE